MSLTSYRPRFATLAATLWCLLGQSVRADATILWITEADKAFLPADVRSLTAKGLEIGVTEDLGPFKKIIPTILTHPDAIVVTADDDLYYRNTWLEELVEAYEGDPKSVICHRAHRIRMGADRRPLKYSDWEHDVGEPGVSPLLFPTGGAGVLYGRAALGGDVTDVRAFRRLAPRMDDIWLYWCGSRNGAIYRKIGGKSHLISWNGSQEVTLYADNRHRNDEAIAAMCEAYGFPAARYLS